MKKINQLIMGGLFLLVSSVLNAQVSIGGYNVYYGHIHNHCNFSDGTGTAAQAYAYARDNGKLDFFSLADHEYSLTTTEYSTMISTANSYNQDGTFVAFYGFEWSHSTYGHVAIIGSSDYCTSAASATNTFSEMVTWLASRDVVAFLNHPGRQNSTGVEFEQFGSTPSDKVVGMELWNKTDLYNVYYYTDGYFTNDGNKSWFDEALTRGWKIGAAGSEDNHSGTWGNMTPAKLAVLGTAKTRTDIMNAMKAKRFYSTLDKDLGLSFKINGSEMGSTVSGGTWTLQILASDGTSDVFSQVQLLKNGAVLNTWTPNTTAVNISQSISCSNGEYYYVRVKQSDGGEAVSSPIWIVGGTANISPTINLTAPANNATYEQPASITITADAADSDGTVTKVEFYQGTTKLGEDATSPYSFIWSGVTAGTYSISAKATDNLGAVTASTAVSVTVYDPNAPITVSSVIATGSDDAEESVASGAVVLTSTDLELIYDVSTTAADQVVGMRFTNLNIPKAAGITNAYIQFTCDEVSTAAASLTIKGEAVDNSSTFTTTAGSISSRSKTTASVSWIPASWPTIDLAGVDQRTPELKSIVQEIVNRTGYTSSSAISIIITGTGARIAEAYEGVPASAAKLYVQFTLVQQITPTFTQIGPLCQNSTPPALPVVSTNGISGTWSPAVISTASAGSSVYTFTPTAGQNATTATMTIVVNPLPSVTNSPLTQAICSGSSTSLVTLTSNVPGTTFTWTATATSGVTGFTASGTSTIPVQTITTSGAAAGTVTYAITPTANSCAGNVTNYIITVNPTPTAPVANVTQPTCALATGTITVTAPTGAGMTYSINGSTYTNTTGIFGGVAAGTYSVTAKSSAGCISPATSATLNAQPSTPVAPTVSLTQPTCALATGTITVTAPTGAGMTYSIDGSTYTNTTGIFGGVSDGTYSVTAKSSAGCISPASGATLNAQPSTPAAPTVSLTQPTCALTTGTIMVTAPTGAGMTYSIDGTTYTNTTGIFGGVSAGTYSVTAKSSAGCISPATSATLNAQPSTPAAPTVSLTQPTCALATGTITLTAPTGAGITYSIDGSIYTNTTGIFSGVAAGTYSVTAKSAAGCVSPVTSATLNAQPSTPAAPTVSLIQPTCALATGTITITAPTGAGITYSIDGSTYTNTTGVFSGVAAGTYSVTAKSAAGCVSPVTSATLNAQPSTPAAPTVSLTQPTCALATGTITITAPTGAGMTYSIDGSIYTNTTGIFSGVAAGTYSVTAKSAAGCVSPVTSATLNAQPSTPAAPTVSLTQPTCALATGTITVTAPTGAGMTYSNGGAYQSSATFSGVAAGSYTVTAKNEEGCISTGTVVTILAQPTTPTAPVVGSITQPTCITPTGSVELSGLPSGNWTINPGNIAGNTTNTIVINLAAGIYTYTVTSSEGCTSAASASFEISASPGSPQEPVVDIIQPTCTEATGTITVTAPTGTGMTYSLNGSTYTNTTGIFSGVASGTYSVTAKSAAGCISPVTSATLNAQPSTPAAPTVSLTQPTCALATGTITVTAPTDAGMTYSIDGTTYTNTTGIFGGVSAGTYSVTAKSSAGCISPATSATLNAQPSTPAAPTVSLTQPTCALATGTITVTAPTSAGMTYSIDGSTYTNTTGIFSGVSAGAYSVTAKSSAGCISPATSATLNAQPSTPAAPTVSLTQPTCALATGTITVTAPTGAGMTYSIDGSTYTNTTGIFSGVTSGAYSVTAKSAAGCISPVTSATLNAQPSTPAAPTVSLTQPTCALATGTITVTAPTGAGMTYSIDGSTYTNTTGIFSGVASGTYSVTAKSSAGCVSPVTSATLNAQPATPAAPTVSLTQPTCALATGTISITAPSGVGMTYSIDGSNYTNTTGIFSGVASGTYSVTAKSSAGCISPVTSATLNAQPSTPAAPTVSLTQPTCALATGMITVTAPTGAGMTYSIDGSTYTNTTGIFSGVAAGAYSVTAKSAAGCISPVTGAILNAQPSTPAAPTVSLTQPTCALATGTITVTAPTGAGMTYSIDGSTYTNTTGIFSGVASGTYSMTAKSAAGCISPVTSATLNPQPSTPAAPTVSLTQPTCASATGTITVTAPTGAGMTYSIDGSTYTNTTGIFSGVATGIYSVTAKSSAGCVSPVTSATLNAQPATPAAPTVSLTQPTCALATGTITITAPTGTGYTYSINGTTYQSSVTFATVTSGTYSVTAKNAAGCISSGTSAVINAQQATPTVTNTPLTQTITSGSNTTLVTLTSNVTGTTFAWTASATAGVTGYIASGTSTIPVQTISTSGTSAGTVTYAIIPTANGCQGTVTNYIITVNPAATTYTLSKRISTGIDDVEEYSSGTMYTNSTDIELVYDSNTTGNQIVGLRFRSMTIPQGAVITKAYIQFTADEVTTAAASLTIKGQNVNNAGVFTTSKKNVSNRVKTTASVAWVPATWPTSGAAGAAQQTPELKTIVQEIVSRTGWASGNSMVFIITGTGKRTAKAYEGSSTAAALLYVEYTLPSVKAATVPTSLIVSERESQGTLTCYPVPFRDVINIQFVPQENETVNRIEIINSSGRIVRTLISNENFNTVRLNDVQPGIYLIRLVTDRNNYVQTVIRN